MTGDVMAGTEQGATAASTLLAGRYRLGEIIGQGAVADVYRAADIRLDRPVAVKMLLNQADGPEARDGFIAEARTLARMSHRGLVTLLDAGFGPGSDDLTAAGSALLADRPFIVMELVDGPSLAALVARGPLPLHEVSTIGVQVADALAYVHAQGVVHRDVKPTNVLTTHGVVKLGDFGIARLVEQTNPQSPSEQTTGTASYLAPEQLRGDRVSGAADVYSLGLVLLEALTGRRETTVPSKVPPGWSELLAAMTAAEPAGRPAAVEVAAEIRRGLGADPTTTRPMPAPDPTVTQVRRPVAAREADQPLARKAAAAAARLKALPREVKGALAAGAALLLFLVLVGALAGGSAATGIPANTPPDLRRPLIDLHQAVDGDTPDGLDKIDAAIVAGDYDRARAALHQLASDTAHAEVDGDLGSGEADEILRSARELLDAMPKGPGS